MLPAGEKLRRGIEIVKRLNDRVTSLDQITYLPIGILARGVKFIPRVSKATIVG